MLYRSRHCKELTLCIIWAIGEYNPPTAAREEAIRSSCNGVEFLSAPLTHSNFYMDSQTNVPLAKMTAPIRELHCTNSKSCKKTMALLALY